MPKLALLFAFLILACNGSSAANAVAKRTDPITFHFATVGDSRADPNDETLSPQDRIWLQNTPVLARITREIEARHVQALMFNGDMIYGYSTDRAVLDKQYAFWRGLMASMMASGTYVLPVPGNHEVQIKGGDGKAGKHATVTGESAWRANMGDLILDPLRWKQSTGKLPGGWNVEHAPSPGTDGITTPQNQLTYSLDVADSHVSVINTDPVGFDDSAPVHWLDQDLAAAKSRGMHHFFIFGHKMAFTYIPATEQASGEKGFDVRGETRDAFWAVVERYGATYFCGHQHVYHASQPRKNSGGKAWQVIVGSGGSPFSEKPSTNGQHFDRFYAWVDVEVYRSGRVHVSARGFPDIMEPSRIIEEWDIGPD